jgi:hypothetical protein
MGRGNWPAIQLKNGLFAEGVGLKIIKYPQSDGGRFDAG